MTNVNRDQSFGRLIAIANVLSKKVYESDRIGVADKYLSAYAKAPAKHFMKIHTDLMEYASRFGPDELHLMDMFQEILANMEASDFTNEPLSDQYLLAYYSQQHSLNNVIGVEEASELWGLSPGTIKNYCAEGKVIAKKIGQTWVIDKTQANPSKTATE